MVYNIHKILDITLVSLNVIHEINGHNRYIKCNERTITRCQTAYIAFRYALSIGVPVKWCEPLIMRELAIRGHYIRCLEAAGELHASKRLRKQIDMIGVGV